MILCVVVFIAASLLRVNYKSGHNLHIQMHDTHRSITVNILVAGTLLYQLVYPALHYIF
jgi:hypothetical protein